MRETERLANVAEWYDSRNDFDYFLIKFGARMILENATGRSLLEVGCGGGVMTEEFVEHFADVVAVDGSEKYVTIARDHTSGRGRFFVSLFEEFDPGQRFDAVVMASVLEHVYDPVGLLKKSLEWLAPGGELHVIVPNAGALNRRVGKAMGLLSRLDEMNERDHMLGHRRVYDRVALEMDIRAAGLTVDKRGGILLKPLSNAQMHDWSPELIEAFYAVGKELPDYCTQIYARCIPAGSA
jgi:2-polyprenyl-3-methyl-5-hydroxy-6-metoxy-1,4-benzoquinol methylase